MNEHVTTDKLVADMKVVMADAEDLLRATASAAGEKVSAARAKMEDSLRTARVKVARPRRSSSTRRRPPRGDRRLRARPPVEGGREPRPRSA